ncbi:MAG: sulfatase [Saprospiraceae bacterium]
MNKPITIWLCSTLLLLCSACNNPKPSSEDQSQKFNVLFLTVDDMNGWNTRNEYPAVKMPYFDKFKKEACNFTKNICPAPVCVPSRAAFFSGIAPHKTGAYYNGCDPWRRSELLRQAETIPECFKRNGYETFGRGKIFHAQLEEGREEAMFDNRPIYKGGFGPFAEREDWVGGKGQFQSVKAWEGPDSDFPDVKNADAAIEFLQQNHDKPFFCYLGLWRPHTPYTAPKRFFELYEESAVTYPTGWKEGDLDDIPTMGLDLVDSLSFFGTDLPSKRETFKRMIYGYLATMSFADWSVGRVIAALDNSPYADNTIVVVASDNGYHMGEKEKWQKGTLWELSAYSPLLIRLPGGSALELPQTVSLMDIYPTLIELCHLTPPKQPLDGESLMAIIRDPSAKRAPSFMTYGEAYSSVLDGQYRYIRYPDGTEELYDHAIDPHEWDNLATPTNRPTMDRLAKFIPAEFAEMLGGRTEAAQKIPGLPKQVGGT